MKMVITQSNLTLKGGAERVVLKMAQHYDAEIYTAEYDPRNTYEEFSGLNVNVIKGSRVSGLVPYGRVMQGLSYGSAFYRFRVPRDYDIINSHMAPSHWARNLNERMIWYCNTPLREVYDMYHYRQSLRAAYKRPLYAVGASVVRAIDMKITKRIEHIFTNSKNTKQRVMRYLNRPDAEILPGGIDYQGYFDDGDGKYFLYPSRISPNKRQEYAINAFRIFKKQMAGYSLILVGPISKDKFYNDYYKRILHLARSAGNVKIMGGVDEETLKGLYSRATAVLYPPMDEDYGLVPLEAMASRKPVIAVNTGGPRETITDGSTGFLVNSEKEMADRMLRVARNLSDSAKMGRQGLDRVRRNYSWGQFFKKFDRGIAKVLS